MMKFKNQYIFILIYCRLSNSPLLQKKNIFFFVNVLFVWGRKKCDVLFHQMKKIGVTCFQVHI